MPGSMVTLAERGGALGRVARLARHGDQTSTVIRVEGVDGGGTWLVRVAGTGVAADALAEVLTTAFAVRRRFAAHLPPRIDIWFDRGSADGRAVGRAHASSSAIWIAEGYVLAGGSRAGVRDVVVHELGHLVDLGFQARRYRQSIELRRRLGEHLGEATIERVVRGTPGYDRLVAEVSQYATTNAVEAFAELFEAWWRGSQTPVVRCFGELVEEYFPQS